MFKGLVNFGLERTGKQALGFYLAYLFLSIILGALTGGIYGAITGDQSFEGGLRAGQIMAIFYCLGLAIAVANNKGLFSSFKSILLVVTSGALAVFIGALGGLIPIAYLSTISNSHNKAINNDA
jgi:hypothetical protein